MKPIEFKGMNTTFAKDQKPYLPLPAFCWKDEWLCVTSCWSLGLFERLKVLFTGRVWATVPTFGKPLIPLKIETECPINGAA